MHCLRVFQTAVGLLLSVAGAADAQKASPRFSDYPATQIVRTPGNRVDLSPPQHRMFRTVLRESSHDTPDFAGHYVVATWGRGSSCESGALIDALTGHVTDLPTSVVRGLSYRLDSRLFIIDPPTTDTTLDEMVPYAPAPDPSTSLRTGRASLECALKGLDAEWSAISPSPRTWRPMRPTSA